MALTTKGTLKLNNELKKAVASSNLYEEFKTFLQFYTKEQNLIDMRIRAANACIDRYADLGGVVEHDGSAWRCTLNGSSYSVEFNDAGDVSAYSVEFGDGKDGRDNVREMQKVFFAMCVLPHYEAKLEDVKQAIVDLQNDNMIRGNAELREIIRDDKYLTVASVSGTSAVTEGDADPFGIFGGDDQQ